MYSKSSLFSLLSLLPFFLSSVSAQSAEADLVGKLRLAPTQVDRINLLQDKDFLFDFNGKTGEAIAAGGRLVNANAGTFPAVIENNIAMAQGLLEPCGVNTPHTHPRATEIQFSVNATLTTGFLQENGARFVFNKVPPGSAAVFPKGSIHFQFNDNCQPALFVAAFNNEDPGTTQIAQRFFGLPPDIVSAALDLGIQQVVDIEAKIPNNPIQGTAACLKRCGIKPVEQATTQRQMRNAGNALPGGSGSGQSSYAPPASSSAYSSYTSASSYSSYSARPTTSTYSPVYAYSASSSPSASPYPYAKQPTSDVKGSLGNSGAGQLAAAASSDNSSTSIFTSPSPILIALLAINGTFVLAALVGVVFLFRSKSKSRKDKARSAMFAVNQYAPQFEPIKDMEGETEYYDPYHAPPAMAHGSSRGRPTFQPPKDTTV